MKILISLILLTIAAIPAAAQQFTIGGGYTTASNRDYHTGGFYGEAKISGKINLLEVGATGLFFHESFGNRGQNATGPAKPEFRFAGYVAPASDDPPIRPFLEFGLTSVRATNDANHWPTAGGGFFWKPFTARGSYLFGDPSGGRPHGWRYGFDFAQPLGDSPFSLRVSADGTKLRGQATRFLVFGGVAYTFR